MDTDTDTDIKREVLLRKMKNKEKAGRKFGFFVKLIKEREV